MSAPKDAYHPPEGQPYAHPRVRSITKDGKKYPQFVHPHHILSIGSRGELLAALKHYGHPMPMLTECSPHPADPDSLRRMVEWIFPTLRWYCKVYHVEVPGWLQGNHWADGLTPEDYKRYLGEKPLDVQEFHESKAHAGTRS